MAAQKNLISQGCACRVELEGLKEGKDIFHEDWCDPLVPLHTPHTPAITTCEHHVARLVRAAAHTAACTLARTPQRACRITADFAGTPEDPVVVTSAFHERVVGVPDPEDDCLVVWSLIKSDEPPKQIIPGGEYFVLKHIEPEAWNTLPESAPPPPLRATLR